MRGHHEKHRSQRTNWLRAAVLGANDGIVSTASLVVGVAAAEADREGVILAGIAGLVAGAMSMAAGEYVSVSSQADTERADVAREKEELATDWDHELHELTDIYVERGLDRELAAEVAHALMEKDPLGAHLRDELGIEEENGARPVQAAAASAASFAVGAGVPLAAAAIVDRALLVPVVAATTLACLAGLGATAAVVGGAKPLVGSFRVTFWGALAMGATALVGSLFGVSV
ncbi:MAG: VIT family protein [Planctomycetota bacterium]